MMLENTIALIEAEAHKSQLSSSGSRISHEEELLNCRNVLHQLRGEPIEQPKSAEKAEGATLGDGKVKTDAPKTFVNGVGDFSCLTGKFKTGDTRTITLPGGATMEMIYCGPGSFQMGSPMDESDRSSDELQHKVTLTKGFGLGKYEVTQAQWKSVMTENPSVEKRDDFPVDNVSWVDCAK